MKKLIDYLYRKDIARFWFIIFLAICMILMSALVLELIVTNTEYDLLNK